jgi:hypothetical protein
MSRCRSLALRSLSRRSLVRRSLACRILASRSLGPWGVWLLSVYESVSVIAENWQNGHTVTGRGFDIVWIRAGALAAGAFAAGALPSGTLPLGGEAFGC